MSPLVRFAPSPTGFLHIGNIRAALINWLFAKANGGQFLLRLDDTDIERSTEDFALAIKRDLSWLGINWDKFARQSDRMEHYQQAIEHLKKTGRLYPAWESAAELSDKRIISGRMIYDRAALSLSSDEMDRLRQERGQPHWRFKLEQKIVSWCDLIKGNINVDTTAQSDPVLIRADGSPLYTLTSVVDDIDFNISHIIRGEDHVTNTGVQIQLFEALGGKPPQFAHLSLLLDASGAALSKRIGSLSIDTLENEGIETITIINLLARLGSSDPITQHNNIDKVIAGFDLSRFSKSPAKFDIQELYNLNERILHNLSFDMVKSRLPSLAGEDFWLVIKDNLVKLSGAEFWWQVVNSDNALNYDQPAAIDITPSIIKATIDLMPDGPVDENYWHVWTSEIATATGIKGKNLFLPIRYVLTARNSGPDIKKLLPLIGYNRIKQRLYAYLQ